MAHPQTQLGFRFTARRALRRAWRRTGILCVTAFTLLGAQGVALAQQLNGVDFLASRAQIAVQMAKVPASVLRHQYLQCAAVSNERALLPGEAIVCTTVADSLMQREFDGDFNALIAWWQANRHSTVAQLQR